MKKTIKTMAIISTALMVLSLLLLVASFPLQNEIVSLFYSGSTSEEFSPQFPLVQFIECLLRTVCVALLILFCGNKKFGITSEILIPIVLVIILPPIYTFAINRYHMLFYSEFEKAVSYNIVSNIASYLLVPSTWGSALAYVTCGMSIAFKSINKE